MANENSEEYQDVKQEIESDNSEKTLTQSEVNALIGRTKAEAYEKGRRQADIQYQEKLDQLNAHKQKAGAHGEDTKNIDVDKIYEEIENRLVQQQTENHLSQVAHQYNDKIAKGAQNYEDFEEVTKDLNMAQFPQIAYLLSGMDDAADIVYELAKNPHKIASIDYLANRSPSQAQNDLRKISASIKANKTAAEQEANAQSPAPLDRLTPSNKTGGNGQLSVSDLRSQEWLKV